MIKRKLMIDADTIRAYKALIDEGIAPPAIAPKSPSRPHMTKRKGSYYICTNEGIKQLNGWIMTVDGLDVGCNKPGDYAPYNITDLKSGALIGTARTLGAVPEAVQMVSKLVRSCYKDKHVKLCIKAIKAAYKAA